MGSRKSRLSRRAFLGTAAGSAALGLLRPAASFARPAPESEILRDYVGRICYNENPLGPSPLAMAAMTDELAMGHRYSDWYAESLRNDLSELHEIPAGQIIAGCGATEILRLAAFAFAQPGKNVVTPYPSYGQFSGDSEMMGSGVRHSGLDEDFRIDLADMLSTVDMNTTAVCITNPNNPTGAPLAAADIAAFVDALPPEVAVIIDEAYHEFVQDPGYESAIELVRQTKNVVVIRTFSKAHGLAGVRIGYGVGRGNLIGDMRAWLSWGTVSRPALAAARAALTDAQHIADSVTHALAAKQYCFTELDAMGVSYIPSETNFFMVDVGDGPAVLQELAGRGINVRAGWGMSDYIRVSVGTMDEMEDFITALGEILEQGVERSAPPKVTALEGNLPNPFRAATHVAYALHRPAHVRVEVFDLRGRLVRTCVDAQQGPGRYGFDWNGTDRRGAPVAAGSYFYRLSAGDVVQTRRMILTR